MSARSDIVGAAGLGPKGDARLAEGSADSFAQAWQTAAARVDHDVGVKRINAASARLNRDGVIGGVGLQRYDPVLGIRKGDVLLVDTTAPLHENDAGGIAFDGRPTVYSSLAGYVLPDGVRTTSQFRRTQRAVGFAPYDSLTEDAATGRAPHYGIAVVTAGSIGSVPHAVPEDIGAGELLVFDVGPINPDARAAWSQNFVHNRNNFLRGSEKAVVRPFNPNGGVEFLATAFHEFYVINDGGASMAQHLSPSAFGENVSSPEQVAAAGMCRPLTSAVWMGVALLLEAGYITLAPTPPISGDTPLFAFTKAKAQNLELTALATRLGLTSYGQDYKLVNSLFGAFWQPLTEHYELAQALSMGNAITNSELAKRIQDEGAIRLIASITDAYYQNAAFIVAKSTHNSKQGNNGMRIVITQ